MIGSLYQPKKCLFNKTHTAATPWSAETLHLFIPLQSQSCLGSRHHRLALPSLQGRVLHLTQEGFNSGTIYIHSSECPPTLRYCQKENQEKQTSSKSVHQGLSPENAQRHLIQKPLHPQTWRPGAPTQAPPPKYLSLFTSFIGHL